MRENPQSKKLTEKERFELVAPNYSVLAAAIIHRAAKDSLKNEVIFDSDFYDMCKELSCRFSPDINKPKLTALQKHFTSYKGVNYGRKV